MDRSVKIITCQESFGWYCRVEQPDGSTYHITDVMETRRAAQEAAVKWARKHRYQVIWPAHLTGKPLPVEPATRRWTTHGL